VSPRRVDSQWTKDHRLGRFDVAGPCTPLVANRQPELARHDADHGVRFAIDLKRATHDAGICGKSGAPDRISENDFARVRRKLFFRSKVASNQRTHAERSKEVVGHPKRRDALGLAATCQRHAGALGHRHVFAGRAAHPPFMHVARIDVPVPRRHCTRRRHVHDAVQTILSSKSQRLEQDAVHN
jgi:hypothetical protein